MREIVVAVLAVGALCSAAYGQDTQICDNPPIPKRFRHMPEPYPEVVRVTAAEIDQYCGGVTEWACTTADRSTVVILSFDALSEVGLTLADGYCLLHHELAHVNGWGYDHEP